MEQGLSTQGEELENQTNVEGKPILLEDILASKDFLVCDYSAHSSSTNYYWNHVYPVNRFSALDFVPAENEIKSVEAFANILKNPKTTVPWSVGVEVGVMVGLLEDKMRYLIKREDNAERSFGKRHNKNRVKHSIERDLLERVTDSFRDVKRAAEESVLSPKHPSAYNFISRMVLEIADLANAKIDYSTKYETGHGPKRFVDAHADEEIVATAIYLCAFENKTGAILTRDSDLRRILRYTLSFLSQFPTEEYRMIREQVKLKGIEIYYPERSGKIALTYDSKTFRLGETKPMPWQRRDEVEKRISPHNPFRPELRPLDDRTIGI